MVRKKVVPRRLPVENESAAGPSEQVIDDASNGGRGGGFGGGGGGEGDAVLASHHLLGAFLERAGVNGEDEEEGGGEGERALRRRDRHEFIVVSDHDSDEDDDDFDPDKAVSAARKRLKQSVVSESDSSGSSSSGDDSSSEDDNGDDGGDGDEAAGAAERPGAGGTDPAAANGGSAKRGRRSVKAPLVPAGTGRRAVVPNRCVGVVLNDGGGHDGDGTAAAAAAAGRDNVKLLEFTGTLQSWKKHALALARKSRDDDEGEWVLCETGALRPGGRAASGSTPRKRGRRRSSSAVATGTLNGKRMPLLFVLPPTRSSEETATLPAASSSSSSSSVTPVAASCDGWRVVHVANVTVNWRVLPATVWQSLAVLAEAGAVVMSASMPGGTWARGAAVSVGITLTAGALDSGDHDGGVSLKPAARKAMAALMSAWDKDNRAGRRGGVDAASLPAGAATTPASLAAASDIRTSAKLYEAAMQARTASEKLNALHEYYGDRELAHPLLKVTLRPYQRRAVHWMLSCEGVRLAFDGGGDGEGPARIEPLPASLRPAHGVADPLWRPIVTADGSQLFVNDWTGVFARRPGMLRVGRSGGVLADEMGLGKTVETLALLLLHSKAPVSALAGDSGGDRVDVDGHAATIGELPTAPGDTHAASLTDDADVVLCVCGATSTEQPPPADVLESIVRRRADSGRTAPLATQSGGAPGMGFWSPEAVVGASSAWVACGECGVWQHSACVGYTERQERVERGWRLRRRRALRAWAKRREEQRLAAAALEGEDGSMALDADASRDALVAACENEEEQERWKLDFLCSDCTAREFFPWTVDNADNELASTAGDPEQYGRGFARRSRAAASSEALKAREAARLAMVEAQRVAASKARACGRVRDDGLVESRATLIISPASIVHQWRDEIIRHTGGDVVVRLPGSADDEVAAVTSEVQGMTEDGEDNEDDGDSAFQPSASPKPGGSSSAGRRLSLEMWDGVQSAVFRRPHLLGDNDIVLTTYEALRKDLYLTDT